MRILAIDVGGTNVKVEVSSSDQRRSFPSGRALTAQMMVDGVKELTSDWNFEAVTVGVSAPVVHGKLIHGPHNLGGGWVGFDFQAAFGKPTKLVIDAAMQAFGDYQGGRM
ncbi:MAG: hypothetical protein ABI614_15725 [Planctomycetota bacterium]